MSQEEVGGVYHRIQVKDNNKNQRIEEGYAVKRRKEEKSYTAMAIQENVYRVQNVAEKVNQNVLQPVCRNAADTMISSAPTVMLDGAKKVYEGEVSVGEAAGGAVEQLVAIGVSEAKEAVKQKAGELVNQGVNRIGEKILNKDMLLPECRNVADAVLSSAPTVMLDGAKKVYEGEVSIEEAAGEAVEQLVEIGVSEAKEAVKQKARELVNKGANEIGEKILKKKITPGQKEKVAKVIIALEGCTQKYINGEIDSGEYFIELLEDGFGAIAGEIAYILGDIVGGPLLGEFCAYIVNDTYEKIVSSCREVRFSKKKLAEIEKVKKYLVEKAEEQKKMYQTISAELYNQREIAFENLNEQLYKTILANDIDGFTDAMNTFSNALGMNVQFETYREFDEFMSGDTAFVF